MQQEKLFFRDDGKIPNNKLPLLIYKNVIPADDLHADGLKKLFNKNHWSNDWDNGIYDYHHYHSITHEVLGVYRGKAVLQMGGEQGEKIQVEAGDVLIIPAGVGHKNLQNENLGVVGAYPNGMDYDLKKGAKGERPAVDKNIAAVPMPAYDPVYGKDAGLVKSWN
jgi:uncharacterized protein YjlB